MRDGNCVIVGASHAGVSLALQLRKEGWDGAIQLIGAEPELPYHRPPLSKEYLAGDKNLDAIRLRPQKLYQDNAIDLVLGTAVTAIEPAARIATLEDGRTLQYDRLALCTGSKVRRLSLAEGRSNVFYVRTVADVATMSALIKPGVRAVIIGAGYIGLETAAVLAQKGASVTVLELADRILNRVTGPAMSDYMMCLHSNHGVSIRTATGVSSVIGSGRVEAVVCSDGSKLDADFVIVGIGIVPETSLAEQAGLAVEQGIRVDAFTGTSDPYIYAAGDCTVHPSAIYQRSLRLESVQNANDQARVAASNIAGKQLAYDAVPWFWSDQYNIKLQTVGVGFDYDQVVSRGNSHVDDSAGFALFYLKNGLLLAADCINRPKEFMVSKQLVKNRVRVDPAMLEDAAIEPAAWLAT